MYLTVENLALWQTVPMIGNLILQESNSKKFKKKDIFFFIYLSEEFLYFFFTLFLIIGGSITQLELESFVLQILYGPNDE